MQYVLNMMKTRHINIFCLWFNYSWPDRSQYNKMNSRCLQDMAGSNTSSNEQADAEDVEKEDKIEMDDPEFLAQARAMDEYKDTHRRGWGNRANRS